MGRGDTPLHHAALSNSLEVVQQLLGARADVEARNNNGSSLIFLVVWLCDLDGVGPQHKREPQLQARGKKLSFRCHINCVVVLWLAWTWL